MSILVLVCFLQKVSHFAMSQFVFVPVHLCVFLLCVCLLNDKRFTFFIQKWLKLLSPNSTQWWIFFLQAHWEELGLIVSYLEIYWCLMVHFDVATLQLSLISISVSTCGEFISDAADYLGPVVYHKWGLMWKWEMCDTNGTSFNVLCCYWLSAYCIESCCYWSYYQWQKWRPCKRSRSEVKGQGHRGHNPTQPFPDCNSSLNSHMMMRWCV